MKNLNNASYILPTILDQIEEIISSFYMCYWNVLSQICTTLQLEWDL